MQDGTCVGRGCVHTGPFPAGLGLEPPLGPHRARISTCTRCRGSLLLEL